MAGKSGSGLVMCGRARQAKRKRNGRNGIKDHSRIEENCGNNLTCVSVKEIPPSELPPGPIVMASKGPSQIITESSGTSSNPHTISFKLQISFSGLESRYLTLDSPV